jgi:hypothetical protein
MNSAAVVSPKVTFASVGAAISTIIWTVLARTALRDLDPTTVTVLAGATSTILAFLLGWLVRDPLREPDAPPPPPPPPLPEDRRVESAVPRTAGHGG